MTGALVFEVVGGKQNGGLLVRQQKSLGSPEAKSRLQPGALVRSIEVDAEAGRVSYELLSGSGPRFGWVTARSQGRELLRPWAGPLEGVAAECTKSWEDSSAGLQEARKGQNATIGRARRQRGGASLLEDTVGGLSVVSYKQYQAGAGKAKLNGRAAKPQRREPGPKEAGSNSDDEVLVCPQCLLPLGELGYCEGELEAAVHGECQAQLLLRQANKEEKARKRKDAELKRSRRAEYDIGWKVERVPWCTGLARKLGSERGEERLYGLVLDEESNTVTVAPTADPAAATNLAYLALALQVRALEGREPLFSLDPKGKTDRASAQWQLKRFEPEWLAGTSLGEVLFQADYHLKELSMGECPQPVVGMKSCLDLFEDEACATGWNAREWFVVREAEIGLSEEGALVPSVSMGVEAREQVLGPNGMEDCQLTRPDHPLVKYADAFTHRFDLIAERKSVVRQLREVAKACLLAKYIVDTEVQLDESWFSVANKACAAREPTSAAIPQLWNERWYHKIQLQDGKALEHGPGASKHGLYGVYGGVEMSLDRLELASLMVSAKKSLVVSATIPAEARAPRGVDLNLDRFGGAVSAPQAQEAEGPEGSWAAAGLAGGAFWSALQGPRPSARLGEDGELLRSVFNANLCDRRDEGDLFLPPDANGRHVRSLQGLIKEEEEVRRAREDQFLSKTFSPGNPGPLFPPSWMPLVEITNEQATRRPGAAQGEALHPRPDYVAEAAKLKKSAVPVFDKSTEDGTRFRIYRVGSLEVRTTEQQGQDERVGAVFSRLRPLHRAADSEEGSVAEEERICKVTLHVEQPHSGPAPPAGQQVKELKQLMEDALLPPPPRHFFATLETDCGNVIMTEQLRDGTMAWSENPLDLEARTSLAKVIAASDCRGASVTVQDMKNHQNGQTNHKRASARSTGKCFAKGVYMRATSG